MHRNIHAFEQLPRFLAMVERGEWLMKPAFLEPCPYENDYRVLDD